MGSSLQLGIEAAHEFDVEVVSHDGRTIGLGRHERRIVPAERE